MTVRVDSILLYLTKLERVALAKTCYSRLQIVKAVTKCAFVTY